MTGRGKRRSRRRRCTFRSFPSLLITARSAEAMSSPDMASKRWIWEQNDRHVMGDMIDISQSGGDAAIVRIHGTNKALAICSDCKLDYVAADPMRVGKQAVAEAIAI